MDPGHNECGVIRALRGAQQYPEHPRLCPGTHPARLRHHDDRVQSREAWERQGEGQREEIQSVQQEEVVDSCCCPTTLPSTFSTFCPLRSLPSTFSALYVLYVLCPLCSLYSVLSLSSTLSVLYALCPRHYPLRSLSSTICMFSTFSTFLFLWFHHPLLGAL